MKGYPLLLVPSRASFARRRERQPVREVADDSGGIKRHAFCATCGAPVYLTFAAMPDLFTIHAASLDDPSRYEPQAVTYHKSGYAWDHLNPDLPKFDRMPPA